jgi:predicted outer membrane repeat protein
MNSVEHSTVIRKNTATNNGGGVYVKSIFDMETWASITENTAENGGGGVFVDGGELTMNSTTSAITGNNVEGVDGNGGGVFVAEHGTFSMTRGSISGNSIYDKEGTDWVATVEDVDESGNVDAYGGKGCGVYVAQNGTFSKTGGAIHGLVNSDGSGWEDTGFQNYYGKRIHTVESKNAYDFLPSPLGGNNDEDVIPSYTVYEKNNEKEDGSPIIPWGIKKGYAVYKAEGNKYRDKTVSGRLSTGDDDGWQPQE